MKPTVLHIHFWADIRNSAGSVEKVIAAFAAHGDRYKHMIACCPGSKALCGPSFLHRGVEVHHFYENRVLNRVMNKMLARQVFTYGSLARLINEIRPDVLHFHNRQELVDDLMVRLDYQPRVAVHYHRHFAEPIIPCNANVLLFISSATARDILGKVRTEKPYCVLPNPLSIDLLTHTPSDKPNRVGFPPTILFGGGNNPAKGGGELVDAFSSLPSGSASLVLAGRNSEKMEIGEGKAIKVCGEVPPTRFFDLMLDADIVAMPSYDEPFGLIAQEAMQMGKLLVTTATGGLAEFIDDSCAIVVMPRNVGSLREGLQRAISILGTSELARLTGNARERIRAFAPHGLIAKLEGHYDELRFSRSES